MCMLLCRLQARHHLFLVYHLFFAFYIYEYHLLH
jgi:hypothetical protein